MGGLRSRGCTLLGVVVALAAVGIGVALLASAFVLEITVSKEEQTRRKLAKLVEVIAGIPDEGTFGFIGDVGRVPKSLDELNSLAGPHTLCDGAFNPSAATFHKVDGATDHRGKVSMGWRGPYFKEMVFSDEHLNDAWGNRLRYACPETTKLATDPTTGGVALTLRTGQITSAGPDGVLDTADDIKAEPFHDRGHLFLTVNQSTGVTGTLYYPVNGEQASQVQAAVLVALALRITFSSVPAGARFVDVTQTGVPTKKEFYHVALKSNIANRLTANIP